MVITIKSDQAPGKQFYLICIQNLNYRRTDTFRDRGENSALDDTRQSSASQGKEPSEVQILGHDHGAMFASIIKDDLIRVTDLSDVPPVRGNNPKRRQVLAPPRWQVLVDDQIHEARS